MAITDKQKQVLSLLNQGKTVGEVAEVLNITKAGVYSHIRIIKADGTEQLPESVANVGQRQAKKPGRKSPGRPRKTATPAAPSAPAPEADANSLDAVFEGVRKRISNEIERLQKRNARLVEESAQLDERMKAIGNEREEIDAGVRRLNSMLAAEAGAIGIDTPESTSTNGSGTKTPDLAGAAAA